MRGSGPAPRCRGARRWAAVLVVTLVALASVVSRSGGTRSTHRVFENGQLTVVHQSVAVAPPIAWPRPCTCRGCLRGCVAFTFLLSRLTDSPAAATVTGVWEVLHITPDPRCVAAGSLRYVLPTHYFDAWREEWIFQGHARRPTWRVVVRMLGYILLFVGLAVWWFRRKDVLS